MRNSSTTKNCIFSNPMVENSNYKRKKRVFLKGVQISKEKKLKINQKGVELSQNRKNEPTHVLAICRLTRV